MAKRPSFPLLDWQPPLARASRLRRTPILIAGGLGLGAGLALRYLLRWRLASTLALAAIPLIENEVTRAAGLGRFDPAQVLNDGIASLAGALAATLAFALANLLKR